MRSIYASVSLILFASKVIALHLKVIVCTYYMCFDQISKDRIICNVNKYVHISKNVLTICTYSAIIKPQRWYIVTHLTTEEIKKKPEMLGKATRLLNAQMRWSPILYLEQVKYKTWFILWQPRTFVLAVSVI